MNKDTKVLLMAVVIILVALVSFNLNDLIGKDEWNIECVDSDGCNINKEGYVFTKDCDVWICHDDYGCDKFKDIDCRR